MEREIRSSYVMEELGITHKTLEDWERKGILRSERNDLGWRIYKEGEVQDLKKRLEGNRDGAGRLRGVIVEY